MTTLVPAEWSPHRAMWLGFPSHPDLWEDDLELARQEVADLARALAGPGMERGRLPVCGDEAENKARSLLGGGGGGRSVPSQCGDILLRDPGPIFVQGEDGAGSAASFHFNGWGG